MAVLLEDNFGINYWLGVAIIIVCAMLLCAYGAKLVRAASSYDVHSRGHPSSSWCCSP
ncbi:MAG: hypothetical protein ACLUEK_07145 [Oscillospiraceae bacterium]